VSPKDKKFVNPLLRSTEASPEAQTQIPIETTPETAMQLTTDASTHSTTQSPISADTQTTTNTVKSTPTYTSIDDEEDQPVERRKRGKQAFDKVHMRWTLWINKKLKKRIDQLAKEQEVSLVALAEEAFTDLMKKYKK
jgi:hypothetical protein